MARDRRPGRHADGKTRLIRRLTRSWRARVAVAGHSMEPTLRDGDWLLVDPDAFRDLQPRSGDLVVVAAEPWLVKRVLTVAADGQLALRGDHAAHADEAVAMPLSAVRGRPWFRYWPPRRMGRV